MSPSNKLLWLSSLAFIASDPFQSALADSAQESSKGFIEDSTWGLLNRTLIDYRDYRHGASNSGARNAVKPKSERNGYAEEWAYGLMGNIQSGFTQGVVGVGLDAHVYYGQQLDSGGGRGGKARLLGVDNDGHMKNNISRGGVAIKFRVSNTTLAIGEQRVVTPVFNSSDNRLLPETATGLFLESKEIPNYKFVAGHFTESTDRNASSHDQGFVVNYSNAKQGNRSDFVGSTYTGFKDTSISLYTSEYEDTWRKHYVGGTWAYPLTPQQAVALNFNLYRMTDTGKALSGKIDDTAWSLISSYSYNAHTFMLGYQEVDGNTPFDYLTRSGKILSNSSPISGFDAPNEKSLQARYDLNMAPYGVPGLTFSSNYVKGWNIDGTHMDRTGGYKYLGYGKDGRHWERGVSAKYVVQSGSAKGMSFFLRYNSHRANKAQTEADQDWWRFSIDFPLTGTF
ncbi:OprD family porin [Pseudomonas sp. v388]|uniref:OprD family porin n=1 Tax=Pseudomonas sp. v388 TaxID=2479849 RepID=UPI000F76AA5B|nr:OprD family porin [Pseudomonas sp. v388]RRV10469.1 OprD family porin [Pseudomonas sp. v388]